MTPRDCTPRAQERKATRTRFALTALLLLVSLGSGAATGTEDFALPDPQARDACPVCGMLVARYPAWIATVQYEDGHADHFDGAKDLFKYLFDLSRYAPGRELRDVVAMGVTEYYGLTRIDARSAWYVVGSEVLGPMGHELVPLATIEDAREFKADHQGTRMLRFDAISPELLRDLDAGRLR
ncbi:nitrous oxide reductase accessory protein NosL [Thioalkalivibrio sp.]|uniref:nitrous oxide reductase accessory protein NosL n=1 Tax=Thioalkalivibrio sp. TaxID=2093813 RepID=UPI003974F04B